MINRIFKLKNLIIVLFFFILSTSLLATIDIDALRHKIESASKPTPETGKISYMQSRLNYSGQQGTRPIENNPEIFVYTKDEVSQITILYDNTKAIIRRDTDDLDYQLDLPSEAPYRDISNTQLIQNNVLVNHFSSMKSIMLDENRAPDSTFSLSHYRYGYLDHAWLSIRDADSVTIEKVIEDEKKLIRVFSEKEIDGKHQTRIVDIDPDAGYRCLKLIEQIDGAPHREVRYENYKKIDGHFVPETYTNKRWINGRLSREIEIVIDNIEFGIPLDDEDFTLEVPEGTMVAGRSPSIPGMLIKTWYTQTSGSLSIDDIINRELDSVATETLENLKEDIPENGNIFLPDLGKSLENGSGYIFDLRTKSIVKIDEHPDSQEMHDHLKLTEKGNIGWDDSSLLAVGKTTIFDDNEKLVSSEESKWTKTYQLPEEIVLPYIFYALDHTGQKHLLTIHQIKENGIHISSQHLP